MRLDQRLESSRRPLVWNDSSLYTRRTDVIAQWFWLILHRLSYTLMYNYLASDVRDNIKLFSFQVQNVLEIWKNYEQSVMTINHAVHERVLSKKMSNQKWDHWAKAVDGLRGDQNVGVHALDTKMPTSPTVRRSPLVESGQSWCRYRSARRRGAWLPVPMAARNAAYLIVYCRVLNQGTSKRRDKVQDQVKRENF